MYLPASRSSIFQPTPSSRRATTRNAIFSFSRIISTHALLAEGDDTVAPLTASTPQFQPTPSSRRATSCTVNEFITLDISTHALLAEGDYGSKYSG